MIKVVFWKRIFSFWEKNSTPKLLLSAKRSGAHFNSLITCIQSPAMSTISAHLNSIFTSTIFWLIFRLQHWYHLKALDAKNDLALQKRTEFNEKVYWWFEIPCQIQMNWSNSQPFNPNNDLIRRSVVRCICVLEHSQPTYLSEFNRWLCS